MQFWPQTSLIPFLVFTYFSFPCVILINHIKSSQSISLFVFLHSPISLTFCLTSYIIPIFLFFHRQSFLDNKRQYYRYMQARKEEEEEKRQRKQQVTKSIAIKLEGMNKRHMTIDFRLGDTCCVFGVVL